MNQKHIEYVAIINSNWYRDKLQLLLLFFIWFRKYPKISKNILIILKHRGYLVYQLLFTLITMNRNGTAHNISVNESQNRCQNKSPIQRPVTSQSQNALNSNSNGDNGYNARNETETD